MGDLLKAANRTMGMAAVIKTASSRVKARPAVDGHIVMSVEYRDALCGMLDSIAQIFDEMATVMEQGGEAANARHTQENR